MSENGRKLSELRVCDLKAELEKRKLDTVGAKAALVERLEKVLKNDGIDPAKHIFVISNDRKKSLDSPMKKVQESSVKIKEEPVDIIEEENEHEENNDENGDYEIDQVGDVDDECYIIEDEIINEDDEENGEEENGEEEIGEEENGEEENVEEENGHAELSREEDCDNADDVDEDPDTDANNHDNDESINLTIGEEEQKLLHDEAPDDKDKMADVNVLSKEKTTVGATSKEKTEKSSSAKKDEKKSSGINKSGSNVKDKEKEKDKNALSNTKTKGKDEKHASEKKETSEVKLSSSSKTAQKDDKEKSSSKNTAGESISTSSTTGNATNTTSAATGNTVTTAKSTTSSVTKNASTSRNLWVSGLAAMTRASDLKTIFSKYGKVIGAKVVTNTRTPGHRCYGYVTMSSSADASRCIEHLHRTELHGRIISVERTKNEIGSSGTSTAATATNTKENTKHQDSKRREEDQAKLSTAPKEQRESRLRDNKLKGTEGGIGTSVKKEDNSNKDRKRGPNEKDEKSKVSKDAGGVKHIHPRTTKKFHGPMNRPRITSRDREQRLREREREQRERVRQREILTYQKIREERERQRLRERERELREEERRRREFRERQRQEEQRLAEERRKLAQERERLEREKAELLRLERERQKLEREKLELERLELKRQQMKIIQSRDDPLKPRHGKRSSTDRYNDAPERKRVPVENRFEIPPPPRFDASLVNPRGSKRDDYVSSSSVSGKRHDSHDFTSTSSVKSRGGGDYAKRDDYGVSSVVGVSKRGAIDDYPSASSKRTSGGDFMKRSGADYVPSSSKRGIGSHRVDYGSNKSSRDADIRHIPVTTTGGVSGSYHKSSGSGRYGDSDRGSGSSGFRRGLDDIRSTGGKRFESTSGYGGSSANAGGSGGSSNLWNGPSGGHIGHGSSNSGGPTLKSYVSNGMGTSGMHGSSWQKPVSMEDNSWRPVPSSQDRYDRTYNERSSGYPSGGSSSNLYGASNGRSAPDRYGAQVRY